MPGGCPLTHLNICTLREAAVWTVSKLRLHADNLKYFSPLIPESGMETVLYSGEDATFGEVRYRNFARP